MTQMFNITINNKRIYFHTPMRGQVRTFPPKDDILIAYIRRRAKNRYEVCIAKTQYYNLYDNCTSMKQACQVLQTVYNG